MKKLNENQQAQEMINELTDTENRLETHLAKLQKINILLSDDKQVLADYQNQLIAATTKLDVTELKSLNRNIQDIERDIQVQNRMKQQIEKGIQILTDEVKDQKLNLRVLLKYIVEHEKLKLELEKGSEILDAFLDLSRDFKNNADSVFEKYGLKKISNRNEVALNVRGNYAFVKHLSIINAAITMPIVVNNEDSHREFYERKLRKVKRIIKNFGLSKEQRTPKEPEEPEDTGLFDKAVNGIKSGLDKVAKIATPEEAKELFK